MRVIQDHDNDCDRDLDYKTQVHYDVVSRFVTVTTEPVPG